MKPLCAHHVGRRAALRLGPNVAHRVGHTRVHAVVPHLDDVEPSPDDIPVPKLSYRSFAPPANGGARVAAKDTSRAAREALKHGSSELTYKPEGPDFGKAELTAEQLEEFSNAVLGSSSSVWSAEERNLPASTSSSSSVSAEQVLAQLKGRGTLAVEGKLKELTKRGELEVVIRAIQDCAKPVQRIICRRWQYQDFLDAVGNSMKAKPAVQYLKLAAQHNPSKQLFMAVLHVCAKARDVDAGMTVVELARKHGVQVDVLMYTTLLKVCKSMGNVDKAYRVYIDMRAARHVADSHVYGVLIATCAEAMKRDLTVVHERKDQFVLLERAFQYVADAEAAGVALGAPVWNALMVCAGRSGELNRAFELVQMMQLRGIPASATTYGSLIESCVCARQPEKALRVFEVAMQKGFTGEVRLYTQALSACMLGFPGAWERALEIYSALQRASVKPDKKFFACLFAVAGRCGRLDTAFELLTDMASEGIRPSGTTASALIHACLDAGNVPLARRVYDLCAKKGVYPVVSQYNRMMDVYASEFRFGEVVSLLCDMVAAGRQPNLNTYRILINAAVFTDQGGLAFQIFALMHANRVLILQNKFAQSIYYMLVKACLNQTRFLWTRGGYPPKGNPDADAAAGAGAASSSGGAAAAGVPHGRLGPSLPAERRVEAEKVLAALGGNKLKRGAHQSNPFDGPPDAIDWASHALSAFHHMLSRGHNPSMELLDLLFNCLRAKRMTPSSEAAYVSPFVPLRSADEPFEVAFEPRAFAVLEEAIGRGLLPRYDPEAPLVMDLRRMPPVVAEVYVLHMLSTLERRAAKKASSEAREGGGEAAPSNERGYYHSITLLVPPFDPDLIKWPSYVQRLMNRYTITVPPEVREKLRERSGHRRSRTRRRVRAAAAARTQQELAAAAMVASDPAAAARRRRRAGDSDAEGSEVEGSRPHASADVLSSYDELEAVLSDDSSDAEGADPWRSEGGAAPGGGLPGMEAGPEADFTGGRYQADCTTGLAVAATFQRMKVWMDMDHVNGVVTVFAVEVGRWIKRRRQDAQHTAAVRAAAGRLGGAGGPAAGELGVGGAVGRASSPGRDGSLDGVGMLGPSVLHNQHNPAAAQLAGPMGTVGGMGAVGLGMGVGSRLMGRGGMGKLEQQQRNIRLGMMGPAQGLSGPGPQQQQPGGPGAGRQPFRAPGAPPPSVGAEAGAGPGGRSRSAPGAQAHGARGPASRGSGGEGRAESAPWASRYPGEAPEAAAASALARMPSPSRQQPAQELQRPGAPRARASGAGEEAHGGGDASAPGRRHAANGSQPHRGGAEANGHPANGSNGYAAGNGSASTSTSGANGSGPGRSNGHPEQRGESLRIAPQGAQRMELSMGPVGMPVTISTMPPSTAAAAEAAATAAAGAGAASGGGGSSS